MTSETAVLRVPEQFSDFLITSRHYLHQHPELGFQEFETSRFIWNTLESHGLEIHGPIAGTGLYVDIEGARPGPHIGYRADIDALPIQDAKHVPYASRNAGVAHLCGHDVHTTIALGVALMLHQNRDAFPGAVRVFFQPNEEGHPSGAPKMIEGGVLQGLEAVYAVHVDPTLPTGRYGLIAGPATASAVRFNIVVSSASTGHSARPHQAVDTVWTAAQIANQLYQLAGRMTDPLDATILTICRFQGGEAYNVIPSRVEFGGTLRCTSLDTRFRKQALIETTARIQAALTGASVDVVFDEGIPPVVNDARLIEHLETIILEQAGQAAAYRIPRPSMGAEDFANYQQHIPGALLRIGTAGNERTAFPLHDAHFDVDEAAMLPAIELLTRALIEHNVRRILG